MKKSGANQGKPASELISKKTAELGDWRGDTFGKFRTLRFRSLRTEDQDLLWRWLHVSLWDPPPAGLRPPEVLHNPGVSIYAEDWGRPTDVGVVAVVEGQDAGACWMRLLPQGVGLAFVNEWTPQLGIALEPQFQHRGYGTKLLCEALKAARSAGYTEVSLTVHPANPAMALYERCGFRKIGVRRNYNLMLASGA